MVDRQEDKNREGDGTGGGGRGGGVFEEAVAVLVERKYVAPITSAVYVLAFDLIPLVGKNSL